MAFMFSPRGAISDLSLFYISSKQNTEKKKNFYFQSLVEWRKAEDVYQLPSFYNASDDTSSSLFGNETATSSTFAVDSSGIFAPFSSTTSTRPWISNRKVVDGKTFPMQRPVVDLGCRCDILYNYVSNSIVKHIILLSIVRVILLSILDK